VKDLSFESPGAPNIFTKDGSPQRGHCSNINVRVSHVEMGNDDYEVSTRLTLHSKDPDDNTICLVEVEQAGIFSLTNVSEDELEQFLKVHCPRVIYPFARQIISLIITSGGFPPLLLQDFDFDAMNQLNQGRNQPESAPSDST
jgi:preprotein translocase subunit SecB